MKFRALGCAVILVALALVACTSEEDPAPFATANDLETRLERDTGVKWLIAREASGVPQILGPVSPIALPGDTPVARARDFFARYADALGPGAGELSMIEDHPDDSGGHELVFTRTLGSTKLPVFEARSAMRFDAAGKVASVQSGLAFDIGSTPTAPTISEASARAAASAYLGQVCGKEPSSAPVVSLGVLPRDGLPVALVYRVSPTEAVGTCVAPTVFVDALTAAPIEVRQKPNRIMDTSRGGSFHFWRDATDVKTLDVSVLPNGNYELRTASAPVEVRTSYYATNGLQYPVTMERRGVWDSFDNGISADAHYHATKALEYFGSVHRWRGLDGKGGTVKVVTHDNSEENSFGANAFYSPLLREIRVGDGADTFLPLSLAFDVMTHELAHGIVDASSELVYEGQSGALNESFADVMGVSAAHWLPELRAKADMRIGRRVTKSGQGIRDLMTPSALDQAETLVGTLPCDGPPSDRNDYCGVHDYSGIPNRAFSLMVFGGAQGETVVKRGVGMEAASRIWFGSITGLRLRRASFQTAAFAQVFEAIPLGIDAVAAVGCAWVAVGVLHEAQLTGFGYHLCEKRTVKSPCATVGNGHACHETAPYSAYVCKGGAIAGAVNCVDVGMRCKGASATDPTATVDAQGRLVCLPSP